MNPTLAEWICTFLKVGKLPLAPGTWGSIAAALIWIFAFPLLPEYVPFVLILVFFFIGAFAANVLVETEGVKDPSRIVIDEVVGQWIAYLGSPFSIPYLIAGFLIFRFFDIVKPPIVRKYEDWPKGWGVMADDVAAGLLTFLVLFTYRIISS